VPDAHHWRQVPEPERHLQAGAVPSDGPLARAVPAGDAAGLLERVEPRTPDLAAGQLGARPDVRTWRAADELLVRLGHGSSQSVWSLGTAGRAVPSRP